ncbi:MAG: ABC transporter ATP-binding protein [Nitrospirota bacterium]|nr:ABC transporter ATP-binding protein [Nitrospirota bacterium]
MTSVYQLKEIYFRYGDAWVLEDICLDVVEGEMIGIIGPNGSGKSSLLKLLSRLNSPQQGDISLRGVDLSLMDQADIAKTTAMVPQESTFFFPYTVDEVVLMGRTPHLRGRLFEGRHDMEVVREVMHWMDIAGLGERPVTEISGGERQRVVIARALAQEPDILILDEPTASLDIAHQVEIYHILTRLNEERGLTIILSSHDLNLAAHYCHRMILMNKGRIYAAGTPSEVITEENIREVYGCPVLVDAHPVSGGPRLTLLPRELKTMKVSP